MRNSPNMKRYLRKCALNVRNVSFLSTFRTFKAHFHCRRNTRDFHNLGRWKDLRISCYLVSYAITSLALQLLCNGKGTAISWICIINGRKLRYILNFLPFMMQSFDYLIFLNVIVLGYEALPSKLYFKTKVVKLILCMV